MICSSSQRHLGLAEIGATRRFTVDDQPRRPVGAIYMSFADARQSNKKLAQGRLLLLGVEAGGIAVSGGDAKKLCPASDDHHIGCISGSVSARERQ
jgi:hypothetical protein